MTYGHKHHVRMSRRCGEDSPCEGHRPTRYGDGPECKADAPLFSDRSWGARRCPLQQGSVVWCFYAVQSVLSFRMHRTF